MKNIDVTDLYKLSDMPGSVFVEKRGGTLVVQVKGKRKYTGLKDTLQNRKIAENIKKSMFIEGLGLKKETVTQHTKLSEAFNIYIAEREITKADKTIRLDKLAFKAIIVKDIFIDIALIEQQLQCMLRRQDISGETKNIYTRQFQTFINHLFAKNYINERINFKKKYYIKVQRVENQIFTVDEVNSIVKYFESRDIEFSILIKLLFNTGLRIGEALNLTWNQVTTNKIFVFNKNDKTNEIVYISNDLYKVLLSIKSNRSKVFRWKESSYSRLNRRLNLCLDDLKIEKNKRSFHEFRKSYLYCLQKSGVPVHIAQKLMRHKNIKVTIEHYQKIDNSEFTKALANFNEFVKSV